MPGERTFAFAAPLWRWAAGTGAWFFVTLPFEVTDEIDEIAVSGGWGSVRVEVTVGGSTWLTSVFPSKEAESFILPVKKSVRVAEGLAEGAPVEVTLRLVH